MTKITKKKFRIIFQLQNLYNFLAQPNVLEYLDLSATDTFLENVNMHLSIMNLTEAQLFNDEILFLAIWSSFTWMFNTFGPIECIA